jgi:protein-L-isoaspartate(D-aspartate) O-methyltransferase
VANSTLEARWAYAEELRFTTHMRSEAVLSAFSTVPRERFLGPGPWRIKSPNWDPLVYWTTPDADPKHVYHDVLIALDEKLGLNNGQPSFWAFLFDRTPLAKGETVIHLGCGTGYYTAILAELVGPTGKVTAIDIHTGNIERGKSALAAWPQVEVRHVDGSKEEFEPADVMVASAGATHPLRSWLNALRPGGRLLFPLTMANASGVMLLVTRVGADEFSVLRMSTVLIYEFSGARDDETSKGLKRAFERGPVSEVRSLRTNRHVEDDTCWLHGDGWCFSKQNPRRE